MVHPLSRRRKFAFRIALILLAVLLPAVLAEALVRLLGVQVPEDPFLHFGKVPPFFTRSVMDGKRVVQVTHRELYRERRVVFPLKKEGATFRVFCLGGSASAGWPHPPREIYSAYLEDALRQAYPGRPVEVINIGAHAYASYRVRMLFEEVLAFDPDLIVLYSGNNEFLERRTYGPGGRSRLAAAANRFAAYRLLRGSLAGRALFPANTLDSARREDQDYAIWSKVDRAPLELHEDPRQLRRVKEHYAFGIDSMARAAGRRGVPLVLVTAPVNLRDWQPNASGRTLQGPELARWQALHRTGRAALLRGEPEPALRALEAAADWEPLHADTRYRLAQALEAAGRADAAVENYSRARDLDANPFRALSDFNAILRKAARDSAQVFVADAEQAFRRASAPRAPGFDLFLDYVHPTRRGNLLLAETVFDVILRQRLLGGKPKRICFADAFRGSPSANSRYEDQTDHGMQIELVWISAMMHQREIAVERARRLMETPGSLDWSDERHRRTVREVLEVFPEALELERREILGLPTPPERRERLQARLFGFYAQAFPGYAEYQRRRTGKSPEPVFPVEPARSAAADPASSGRSAISAEHKRGGGLR